MDSEEAAQFLRFPTLTSYRCTPWHSSLKILGSCSHAGDPAQRRYTELKDRTQGKAPWWQRTKSLKHSRSLGAARCSNASIPYGVELGRDAVVPIPRAVSGKPLSLSLVVPQFPIHELGLEQRDCVLRDDAGQGEMALLHRVPAAVVLHTQLSRGRAVQAQGSVLGGGETD